jgi:hypothetical protein
MLCAAEASAPLRMGILFAVHKQLTDANLPGPH